MPFKETLQERLRRPPQEHQIDVNRSVRLVVRDYLPTVASGGVCVLVHGAFEHGGRHRHVAERLCRNGWRVVVPDLRGHGRSGGPPMHLLSFDRYVEDLVCLYDALELDPARTVQVGHSLGGLVTIRLAQQHPTRLAALCPVCPLLGLSVPVPRLLYACGRVCSWCYPWKRFAAAVDPTQVTRNARSIADREEDPLYRQSISAGWYFAVRRAMRRAWRDAVQLTIPILLVQSGDDRVVDAAASRSWLRRIGSTDRQFHRLAGQFHEWHYEASWPVTTDLIDQWLTARLAGAIGSVARPVAA